MPADAKWVRPNHVAGEIPKPFSGGSTRDEAQANIREAIALCLEVRAERGLPWTIETRQVEVTL